MSEISSNWNWKVLQYDTGFNFGLEYVNKQWNTTAQFIQHYDKYLYLLAVNKL